MTGQQIGWWLVENNGGGLHYTYAASAAEARQNVRQGIFEAGRSEGMTWREARHYSHTFGVSVVAGPCERDEVVQAVEASSPGDYGSGGDYGPAEALRERVRIVTAGQELPRMRVRHGRVMHRVEEAGPGYLRSVCRERSLVGTHARVLARADEWTAERYWYEDCQHCPTDGAAG